MVSPRSPSIPMSLPLVREDTKPFPIPIGMKSVASVGRARRDWFRPIDRSMSTILYVGNGLSDRCGAKEADFVFAKDSLYAYCIDEDIPCHFFHSFQEILNDLKKRIRGIIFDLDGTLVEAYEAIYLGLRDAFQRFGKEIFPYADLRHHLKADLETTLSPFFSPEEVQQAIPVMRKKYEEIYLEKSHLLDGAGQVLKNLYSQNISLGCSFQQVWPFCPWNVRPSGCGTLFRSIVGVRRCSKKQTLP